MADLFLTGDLSLAAFVHSERHSSQFVLPKYGHRAIK